MTDEQIIYIKPEEELNNVRERLEHAQAQRIILIIPTQTQLRSHVGWRLLHARARALGKDVLVISSDRQIRAVVKAAGFRVADSQEPTPSGGSHPGSRPSRAGQGGKIVSRLRPPLPSAVPDDRGSSADIRVRQRPQPTRRPPIQEPKLQARDSGIGGVTEPTLPTFDAPSKKNVPDHNFRIETAPSMGALGQEHEFDEPDPLLEDYQRAQFIRQAVHADLVGQQIGNYRLIQLLGRGSFGDVYLGEHIQLGTKAAIKILQARVNAEEFQNGTRRIARLVHPHIVRILDSGLKYQNPFLVMDYVPNGTLHHRHSNNNLLPLTTVVDYVRQVAAALQYVHDQNLLLGDVKPENMLIGDDNEILLSGFDSVFADQTKEGFLSIGQYTAPEQLSGKLIPASDQYALGVVVYEWLSGEPPLSFNIFEDFHEKTVRLMNTSPLSLRTRVPTIPPDVEEVVMKALAKDPTQRFASVEAFANALAQASLPIKASKSPKLIGQQFGKYYLISLLGEGGFADVYLGKHLNLNTLAAVKVQHTRLTSGDIEPFRNEARMIARLKHPNIVRILDFDVEDNIPFLVMDQAPNGTLRDRYTKGSVLPPTRILRYVKQVALALQYAHDRKLIHRDVKPGNMLIGPNNDIWLSDFGIAVITHRTVSQVAQEIAGTAVYMSPEQFKAKAVPASDQYSLAILVYEWLCGTPPFKGDFIQLGYQHAHDLPSSLQEKNPTISSAVEQVVMIALAKDPQRRFASVQAFAMALEQACQQLR